MNAADPEGRTALAYAVRGGHHDVVQRLLDQGADPTVVPGDGETLVESAERDGEFELAGLLKEHLACLDARCGAKAGQAGSGCS